MAEIDDKEIRPSLVAKEEAQARLADATVTKELAEAGRFNAERIKFELDVASAEISYRTSKRGEDELMQGDKFHHMYQFLEPVSQNSVKTCMAQLSLWHRMDPGAEIEISFNSPGGEIISGMALFDFIQEIKSKGHHVVTSTRGMAASMAGILLQAGDHRVMARQSWLLIHEASFGASGSMGSVEDTVEWVKRIQKRIIQIFAERSTLTAQAIAKRWLRKDWWISSEEALKWGFIDEIRG